MSTEAFLEKAEEDLEIEKKSIRWLTEQANEWSKLPDLKSKCAAILIYSNLTEGFAENLINYLLINMNDQLNDKDLKVQLVYNKINDPSKTNLEHLILRLHYFDFPQKKKFVKLFNRIQSIRNNLLHNLLAADKRGNRDISGLVNDLHTSFNELFELWVNLMREIINKFPSQKPTSG